MSDSLLHQIQMEAVDSKHDLPSILRKCRILAQRISNSDLKEWVVNELDGYHENPVPDYRQMSHALLFGDYFGIAGSRVSNIQIPATAVMEQFRDDLLGVHITHGVAEIQSQIATAERGAIRIAVPPECHQIIKYNGLREDLVLVAAFKVLSTTFLNGILDTVRNRILNFTLELEAVAPETGDPLENLKMEKPEKVQQIFRTEIKGNVGNFAQGGSDFTQVNEVAKSDSEGLRRVLKSIGVEDKLTTELVKAAESEKPTKGNFGNRVSTTIGKIVGKASEGAMKVGPAVAANLIAQAIKNFYGM